MSEENLSPEAKAAREERRRDPMPDHKTALVIVVKMRRGPIIGSAPTFALDVIPAGIENQGEMLGAVSVVGRAMSDIIQRMMGPVLPGATMIRSDERGGEELK